MAAKLVAEEGTLKGLVLSLEEGEEWVIGRDPEECQLLIEDPTASRKHLICRQTTEGITIENLSETNPIQVNEEEIEGSRVLHHGDLLRIGSGIFRFYAETAAHVDLPTAEEEERMEEKAPEKIEESEPTHDTIFEEEGEEQAALAEIDFNLTDTGRWILKVVAGPNNGAEFSMQPSTSYVIGTDHNMCDIVFHDISVSRQHARITIHDDETVTIEDLNSRNETVVEGKRIEERTPIASNTLISTGTTAFVVFDRERERETIISPLLPSIVKVLQQEEGEKEPAPEGKKAPTKEEEKHGAHVFGRLVLLAVITGLFVVVGVGVSTLFQTQEVVRPIVDPIQELDNAINPFPSVKYSFNKTSGQLLLVGHVLTAVERSQLFYNLQGLDFIKRIDDSIIIDEYVWQEINLVLGKNPNWRGITVYAPKAEHFVITGYLTTREQAETLTDYLNQNFPYLDLLEKRVIVEEDVVTQANVLLQEEGFRDISVQMSNGELKLTGTRPFESRIDLDRLMEEMKEIPGVRSIKNFVVELAPAEAIIDISEDYVVSGSSAKGSTNINVVINGRILSEGDTLDGMTIIEIKANTIFLERDNVKYKIEYNK